MWQHVAGGQGEWEYLPLEQLEGAEVCVAAAPLESALVTTIASVRSRRRFGVLRRRDLEALRPLIDYRTRAWPSCLTRRRDERDFAAGVEAGVRSGRLHAGVWAPVLEAPERWLRAYDAAMERVWPEVEPRWRRASDLLAREAERIEAAVERGGALALTHTAGSVRDGEWRLFERAEPEGLRLRRGRLVLRPLLAPISLVEADDELRAVSYPLTVRHDDSPPASLEGLLAPSRATILRALDRPVSAGRLAERHGFSPSGITHHLGALERAGLIVRERDGRTVVVHRTLRGTQLLALYE
jgi:DNA-binding transcriptional ArsR family regulator